MLLLHGAAAALTHVSVLQAVRHVLFFNSNAVICAALLSNRQAGQQQQLTPALAGPAASDAASYAAVDAIITASALVTAYFVSL